MRLIINIPCYNEEKTLPAVLDAIPKEIDGISRIDIQVVDDGSTDRTAEIARKRGCHVISHRKNLGLGVAFRSGAEHALKQGYDIFVNTDGDNQYPGKYIPALVKPIVDKAADAVIGNRSPWSVRYFSGFKRMVQLIGNRAGSLLIGTDVPDIVSGFRAYSRKALASFKLDNRFSYVIDTVVQARSLGLRCSSIDISINRPVRKSRLTSNILQHTMILGWNIIAAMARFDMARLLMMLMIMASIIVGAAVMAVSI